MLQETERCRSGLMSISNSFWCLEERPNKTEFHRVRVRVSRYTRLFNWDTRYFYQRVYEKQKDSWSTQPIYQWLGENSLSYHYQKIGWSFMTLKAEVMLSQRLNENPHLPWVAIYLRGTSIETANYTSMAGLEKPEQQRPMLTKCSWPLRRR